MVIKEMKDVIVEIEGREFFSIDHLPVPISSLGTSINKNE